MGLTASEKQMLYHHLAQLLRAGVPFPRAVEKLSKTSSGAVRRMLNGLQSSLQKGDTVGQAFAARAGDLSQMERAAIGALERTARMDHGLNELSEYFGAMHRARKEIVRKCMYPLFLVHMAVLLPNLAMIVGAEGVTGYLIETGKTLGMFYAGLIVCWFVVKTLRDVGSFDPMTDWWMRKLPLLGKIRKAMATSRFSATYDMQLEAGVNVIDSLLAAGSASQSGLIHRAAKKAAEGARNGEAAGESLAASRAFPEDFGRALLVAEETGDTARVLPELTREYRAEAFMRINTLTEWLPRAVFLVISCYVGWRIVRMYSDYIHAVEKITSGM